MSFTAGKYYALPAPNTVLYLCVDDTLNGAILAPVAGTETPITIATEGASAQFTELQEAAPAAPALRAGDMAVGPSLHPVRMVAIFETTGEIAIVVAAVFIPLSGTNSAIPDPPGQSKFSYLFDSNQNPLFKKMADSIPFT